MCFEDEYIRIMCLELRKNSTCSFNLVMLCSCLEFSKPMPQELCEIILTRGFMFSFFEEAEYSCVSCFLSLFSEDSRETKKKLVNLLFDIDICSNMDPSNLIELSMNDDLMSCLEDKEKIRKFIDNDFEDEDALKVKAWLTCYAGYSDKEFLEVVEKIMDKEVFISFLPKQALSTFQPRVIEELISRGSISYGMVELFCREEEKMTDNVKMLFKSEKILDFIERDLFDESDWVALALLYDLLDVDLISSEFPCEGQEDREDEARQYILYMFDGVWKPDRHVLLPEDVKDVVVCCYLSMKKLFPRDIIGMIVERVDFERKPIEYFDGELFPWIVKVVRNRQQRGKFKQRKTINSL